MTLSSRSKIGGNLERFYNMHNVCTLIAMFKYKMIFWFNNSSNHGIDYNSLNLSLCVLSDGSIVVLL